MIWIVGPVIKKMKIGILTDLKPWSKEKLMRDMRNQFAYSVALFIFIAVILGLMHTVPEESYLSFVPLNAFAMFCVFELCTWFSFIRIWRELNRRIKKESTD